MGIRLSNLTVLRVARVPVITTRRKCAPVLHDASHMKQNTAWLEVGTIGTSTPRTALLKYSNTDPVVACMFVKQSLACKITICIFQTVPKLAFFAVASR